MTELPLNGRQYLNLVAIAPNVNVLSPAAGQAGARLGGERAQQSISAGGQRIFFNYYTLDGVNNTDPNFNNYIALPSIDAIQEFKVQTGVYPAEFGHQSTQVNVVTKSGGNTFHGSIFEFLRDEKFDAKPYAFTSVHPDKSPFKWNDFGFEVDGPVLARQVVLHGQLRGAAASADHADHVHGADRQDVRRRLQRDPARHGHLRPDSPASRSQATSSRRAGSTPISQNLLEYYHSSTLPGLTNNYVQDNSQPFDRKGYVVRADFNESSSSQWMGRYNWGDDDAVEPGHRSGGFEDRHELQAVGRLEHPDAQLHAGQRRAVRLHQVLQLDRHPLGLYQRCGRRSEDPEPEIRRPGHVGHSERRVHRVQRHR